jgi:hypothetical protein
MQFQLRVYRARPGELDDFVREWTEHVLPLRLRFGFSVLGPWVAEDEDLFVWILGHDGDWEAEDARYYASPERHAIDPDPARHLVETRHTLMRAPAPARAPEP